jgi:cytidylate kinase
MIITINGTPGSGKSTVAKFLAKKLRLKHYSMGDLRRKMALERGMNIDELDKLGEKNVWTDKDVDDYQKKLGKKEDNFVIDGRLSWHFIPSSLKIFLKADLKKAAERIFKKGRKSEKKYKNSGEVLKEIKSRMNSEAKRYKKYYKITDVNALKNYDIVIDTSYLTIPQMEKAVYNAVKKYQAVR